MSASAGKDPTSVREDFHQRGAIYVYLFVERALHDAIRYVLYTPPRVTMRDDLQDAIQGSIGGVRFFVQGVCA